MMDSTILSEEEKDIFIDIIEENNYKLPFEWKLLYRSSRDGFEPKIFHKKCDGIPNTICIIHTHNNNVFGGYTTIPWGIGAWHTDKYAFIFLIRSSNNYKLELSL